MADKADDWLAGSRGIRRKRFWMLRKQYHFRKAGQDLHIWDVHRLIRLSKSLNASLVPLEDIAEIDENWWYEGSGEIPTPRSIAAHMTLVEQVDPGYPILLCPDGRVMDGMHRLVRALLEKRSHILAIRLIDMPEPDFINASVDDLPYPDEDV